MNLALVLAQVLNDPISNGSGWIGAGLLGAVLSWLLGVHLPAKDKQLNDFIARKDEHLEKMALKFEAALNAVIEHCRAEMESLRKQG